MRRGRKNHSAKFKAKVALEAIKGERSISELASLYEIHPSMIGRWKKQLLEQVPEIFFGKRSAKAKEDERLKEKLYQEIGQLKVELDWLKKKSGIDY
jgi:transposase